MRLGTALTRTGNQLSPHVSSGEIVLGIIAITAVLVIAYRISLWMYPMSTCRRCGGSGKVSGGFLFGGRAFCGKCGGQGLVPRLGTSLLDLRARPPRWQGR
jgi:hypothetical protein